ncbi:uncharacterized protein LOC143258746 [Megalopta genalis]|uniref:uncharacterized protein LOC143258746 n=1 Tax=Megalopta genalis TaxID=115081 RepID=UPI003FD47843
MKLFVALFIFVTVVYVSVESAPSDFAAIHATIKHILKREAGYDDMATLSSVGDEHVRVARRARCDANWFIRMISSDEFGCNADCIGERYKASRIRWNGGKCKDRRCVCY